MSASLVGSEMCIRDRLELHRPAHVQASGGARAGRKGANAELGGRGMPGAVSYTHLTLPTICSV
eukprot:7480230-Alexandrium_andersonii.AAC.1